MNKPMPNRISFFIGWLFVTVVYASPVIEWDFSNGLQGWTENNQITEPTVTDEGITFESLGEDLFIVGPPVNVSSGNITHVRTPAASLRFGRLDKLLSNVYRRAQDNISDFTPEGTIPIKLNEIILSA